MTKRETAAADLTLVTLLSHVFSMRNSPDEGIFLVYDAHYADRCLKISNSPGWDCIDFPRFLNLQFTSSSPSHHISGASHIFPPLQSSKIARSLQCKKQCYS